MSTPTMSDISTRRQFFQDSLCCAATCMAAAAGLATPLAAADATPVSAPDRDKAVAIHDWLTTFITGEEKNLDRDALVKLLEQRGRQCCARLDFRRQMIAEANGDVDALVRLLGERVRPENCVRDGDTITLVYPVDHCVCGWSPKRETPSPDDPYCNCSKANNQQLFETVSGRPVSVQVTDSPRRTGKPCRFVIELG